MIPKPKYCDCCESTDFYLENSKWICACGATYGPKFDQPGNPILNCEAAINNAHRNHTSSDLAIAMDEILDEYGEDIYNQAQHNITNPRDRSLSYTDTSDLNEL